MHQSKTYIFSKLYNLFMSVFLSGIASFFLFDYSADAENYYSIINSLSLFNANNTNYGTEEVLFWGYFDYFMSLGVSFKWALFLLLTLSFYIKSNAFFFLYKKINNELIQLTHILFIYCIYIAFFYLLHEGTQLRIACGLAFSLQACVYLIKKRFIFSFLFSLIAFGFHITSPVLFFVFGLCLYFKSVYNLAFYFLSLGIIFYLVNISVINFFVSPIAFFLGGSYIEYTTVYLDLIQNKSGLAFIYAFLFSVLSWYLKYWNFSNSKSVFFDFYLSVSVYGIAILFFFHETVAVASRLSDIILIMYVPLLSFYVVKSNVAKKIVFFLLLNLVFAIRFYQLFPSF